MEVRALFELWRSEHKCEDGWGLAWYLAYEFCVRFYASHGILPGIMEHDGMGYCGIQLEQVQCKINPEPMPPLGRITASGNIENWTAPTLKDKGVNTIEMCDSGEELDRIVAASISHMRIPPFRGRSHKRCQHNNRGKAYEIMFAISTILALRNDYEKLRIWNRPFHTQQVVLEMDHLASNRENDGAFIFEGDQRRIVISSSAHLLGVGEGEDVNYLYRYRQGESVYALALEIESLLGKT